MKPTSYRLEFDSLEDRRVMSAGATLRHAMGGMMVKDIQQPAALVQLESTPQLTTRAAATYGTWIHGRTLTMRIQFPSHHTPLRETGRLQVTIKWGDGTPDTVVMAKRSCVHPDPNMGMFEYEAMHQYPRLPFDKSYYVTAQIKDLTYPNDQYALRGEARPRISWRDGLYWDLRDAQDLGPPNWPNLRNFQVIGPSTWNPGKDWEFVPGIPKLTPGTYNCISHTLGLQNHWTHPPQNRGAWDQMYGTQNYTRLKDSQGNDSVDTSYQRGVQKIAVFKLPNEEYTHAAIQQPDGSWQSKMGDSALIRHQSPQDVAGGIYGQVVMVYTRPNASFR